MLDHLDQAVMWLRSHRVIWLPWPEGDTNAEIKKIHEIARLAVLSPDASKSVANPVTLFNSEELAKALRLAKSVTTEDGTLLVLTNMWQLDFVGRLARKSGFQVEAHPIVMHIASKQRFR
jgi:hypothetical protein